jgi:hypothetical protein
VEVFLPASTREGSFENCNEPYSSAKGEEFADRWCHVISATDPYGRIIAFTDRSRYFFFQATPPELGPLSLVITTE